MRVHPGLLQTCGYPVETASGFLYQGYKVVPFYDSMTAKLIVHGADRAQAIKKLLCALDELHIDGIQTNIEEQKKILRSAQFQSGTFGTSLYAQLFEGEK